MNKKTYAIDLDGVLIGPGWPDDQNPPPIVKNILRVNALHAEGHIIILHTSRSGNFDRKVTEAWLEEYGVLYARIAFDKPLADFYIDDKAINVADWEAA